MTQRRDNPGSAISRRWARRDAAQRGYAAIGLWHPKYHQNVGSTLRAAGCFGAAMIAIQGKRYERAGTDTECAVRRIPLIHGDLRELIPFDCVPVAVEISDRAKPLETYQHPPRGYYVFGPEDGSLPSDVLAWCRDVVEVQSERCMNLGATVSIVLYDRAAKFYRRRLEAPAAAVEVVR